LNLPISDTLAVRAAGNRNQHDGYFSNGAMDRATTSGRLSALYSPSDATSVYAVASYSHDGGIGLADQNIPPKGNNWYLPFDARANGIFTDASTWTSSLEVKHEFAKAMSLRTSPDFRIWTDEIKLNFFWELFLRLPQPCWE